MLGTTLETRIAKHHKELENFAIDKQMISQNCEALNVKIPHNLLHLKDENLLKEDELGNMMSMVETNKGEIKRKVTKLRPQIIQIRLEDLPKVDKQVNHDHKYVLLWDRTQHGTVNAQYRSRGIVIELDR